MSNDKTTKSDSDWRRELTPERYRVLRQHGTEPRRHQPTQSRETPG